MIEAKYFIRIIKGNKTLYESSKLGENFTANSDSPRDLAKGLSGAINKTNSANFVKTIPINEST